MTINTVVLSGHLGADPQLKYMESGTVICNFSIAVQGYAKGGKKTLWFDCKAFNKTAEILAEHLRKGHLTTVSGSLDIEQWSYELDCNDSYSDSPGVIGKKYLVIVRDFQFPPKDAAKPAQFDMIKEEDIPY